MWQQNYIPLGDSLAASALVAGLPIFTLLLMLGVLRKPAWMAGLTGLATAMAVALFVYGMPATAVVGAVTYGAAFGLLPIGWIVFSAILLYRITLETGNFEVVKDSVGNLTPDRRLQALLIAFAFGAFATFFFFTGFASTGSPFALGVAGTVGRGVGSAASSVSLTSVAALEAQSTRNAPLRVSALSTSPGGGPSCEMTPPLPT
jgi:lactate permease